MINVCFFCGDISLVGGTNRVATVIASALAERGMDVSILSVSNGGSSSFPLNPNVKLFSLNMQKHSANLSDLIKWIQLRKFLKMHNVDVVIDVDVVLSWYSIPATWGIATKVISWEHFHFGINVGDIFQRWRRSLGRRMAVCFASAVVTLTEKDKQQYLNGLTCKTRVLAIPNPQTITHEKRANLDSKLVIAAGRLVPQKGFDLLLEAWSLVISHTPGWRLRIVGSGQDELMLKVLAEKLSITSSVEFIPNTVDIESHFEAASIYAMTSRFEGLPLVLLEAKSFGQPIVSFDCDCGPSDIIRNGIDGVLVPYKDVYAFALCLRMLMDDSNKRKAMGQNAYEDRRFDLSQIADEWQQLLSKA